MQISAHAGVSTAVASRNRYEAPLWTGIVAPVSVNVVLLGPPRVERNGEPVHFDTRKAIALLAHLALVGGARSRDSLCELLWPRHDPDRSRGALRRTLSTLRGAIGEEWIETPGDAVALRKGAGLELDVARFRALAAEGSSAESLTEAVETFSGDFLEGFAIRDSPEFDHWQTGEADGLRRELSSALRRLVALHAERGEHEPALGFAERWVEIEPLHEPAHRELIRLYALTGDRGAALQQYRQCVRALSQELGVAPLEETTALFEQVSEGALPPAAARPPSAERRAATGPRELPLVGRDSELDGLLVAHRAAGETGVLAVVEGEAGIGKTRLCHELSSAARADGALVLAAQCHEDEAGLPYAPIVELLSGALQTAEHWVDQVSPQRLADASHLQPELGAVRPGLPNPHSLSAPGAQVRLLEAVAAVLDAAVSGPAPGVLFLDDVQAADEATVDVLAYLGRRLDERSMLLLLSWRSEAVPPGHRLRRLRGDREREPADRVVRLDRLDRAEVGALVGAAAPSDTAEVSERVFRESEGLPLFVAEYVLALQTGDDPPGAAHTLLVTRLSGVGAVARQVLGAGAAIGRSFDFDTVLAASGRSDEEVVAALEELVEHGLVREAGPAEAPYDFAHQKLRELVYEETSPARRRLLHRRIAASLPRADETAALVAQQLRLAGERREAAEQFRIAAEHAASLLAHADAVAHLEAALALDPVDATGLHERLGDLHTLAGDYAGALASYETAAAESEGSTLAVLEQKLGGVHGRRGDWERAEARLTAALDVAPADDRGLRARIVADLALSLHHTGRKDEAAARAREARGLAEEAADRRALAQAHNMLGVLARSDRNLTTARTELERSIALAEELDEAPAEVAALNNLALAERDAGELDRALVLTERARELCAAYGDRHREAALENNLADLHHEAGREEEAMAHLKQAVSIFAQVGADEATRLPEIWKLVSW
jgi:DNA-binding SARP family transcriptional activator/tetratricopeptide (TPR) repeat protein